MARRILGPVRQAAYDAAQTAREQAQATGDEAKKSIFLVTEKAMVVLAKACDVLDDVVEGKITFKVFGKKVPIDIEWNIKEEEVK